MATDSGKKPEARYTGSWRVPRIPRWRRFYYACTGWMYRLIWSADREDPFDIRSRSYRAFSSALKEHLDRLPRPELPVLHGDSHSAGRTASYRLGGRDPEEEGDDGE